MTKYGEAKILAPKRKRTYTQRVHAAHYGR